MKQRWGTAKTVVSFYVSTTLTHTWSTQCWRRRRSALKRGIPVTMTSPPGAPSYRLEISSEWTLWGIVKMRWGVPLKNGLIMWSPLSLDPRYLHKWFFNPAAQSDRSTAVRLAGSQQEDPSGHRGQKQWANQEGAHHNFHSGVQGHQYGGEGNEVPSCGGRGFVWFTGCGFTDIFFVGQYSQMRDELFKSNIVCSFILSLLLMAVQVLIPAPRYANSPVCSPSSSDRRTFIEWLCNYMVQDLSHGGPGPGRWLR